MALVKGIVFVTTASAVVAGFSHPMHFRKVDANTAKSVAAFKKLNITTGDGLLANEQVSKREANEHYFSHVWALTPNGRAFGFRTSPSAAAMTLRF